MKSYVGPLQLFLPAEPRGDACRRIAAVCSSQGSHLAPGWALALWDIMTWRTGSPNAQLVGRNTGTGKAGETHPNFPVAEIRLQSLRSLTSASHSGSAWQLLLPSHFPHPSSIKTLVFFQAACSNALASVQEQKAYPSFFLSSDPHLGSQSSGAWLPTWSSTIPQISESGDTSWTQGPESTLWSQHKACIALMWLSTQVLESLWRKVFWSCGGLPSNTVPRLPLSWACSHCPVPSAVPFQGMRCAHLYFLLVLMAD